VHAENLIIILASIVSIFGGDLDDHSMSMRIKFNVMMNSHKSSTIYEDSGYGLDVDLLVILQSSRTNCVFHILEEVG
jgi:hypothetical protein